MEMADMQMKRGRLLVLVPNEDMDEVRYARKARQVAVANNLDIQFISLNHSPEDEAQARRKLVTLSGIAGTTSITSDFTLRDVPSWLDVIQMEFTAEDHILCPTEINSNSFYPKESEDLRARLNGRVHFIPGMMTSSDRERIERITRIVLNWAGILTVIAVGFLLEVDFDRQIVGLGKTLAEIAVFAIEIGILWWWNTFVNRFNY
jgi:hypothetical protein